MDLIADSIADSTVNPAPSNLLATPVSNQHNYAVSPASTESFLDRTMEDLSIHSLD